MGAAEIRAVSHTMHRFGEESILKDGRTLRSTFGAAHDRWKAIYRKTGLKRT